MFDQKCQHSGPSLSRNCEICSGNWTESTQSTAARNPARLQARPRVMVISLTSVVRDGRGSFCPNTEVMFLTALKGLQLFTSTHAFKLVSGRRGPAQVRKRSKELNGCYWRWSIYFPPSTQLHGHHLHLVPSYHHMPVPTKLLHNLESGICRLLYYYAGL